MRTSNALVANHRHVYDVLHSSKSPMTAYELLDAVREHGISAPPTVYRALNRLIEEGLAHRIASINAYVACSNPHRHHDSAVLAICGKCGSIEELFSPAIFKRLKALAIDRHFRVKHSSIEITGVCGPCEKQDC